MYMEIGDNVEKINGYKYPGVVVAKFKKIDNMKERFVVECTEPSCAGMLFIFREGQLKIIKAKNEETKIKKLKNFVFRGLGYDL